jgi:lysophospholipase L1-like esterase
MASRRINIGFVIVVAACVPLGSFLLGMQCQINGLCARFAIENNKLHRQPGSILHDDYGRLVAFPGKQQVDCPAQTPHTAVLLVFGQSNSANYQGQRYRAVDRRVVNFFGGKCYLAESPLLGASGELGESWTLLGNKLVAAGLFDQVILIPAGIGATLISRWAVGGDLNGMLVDVINEAEPVYKVTHVLWHQGENDFANGTPEAAYFAAFQSIVATLKAAKVFAPVYVSKATYGAIDRLDPSFATAHQWRKENPVAAAQTKLPDGKSIFAGPDTDSDVLPLDRYDGVHFSGSGQEIFANRWLEILKP